MTDSHLVCYVAAPYERRDRVREVHASLRGVNVHPSSTWATTDYEGQPTRRDSRAAAALNDVDIERSHCLLVLAYPGEGGEMFCEVSKALLSGIPIVWTGRQILSTHRDGVLCVPTVTAAVGVLREWASFLTQPPWSTDMKWARERLWDLACGSSIENGVTQDPDATLEPR